MDRNKLISAHNLLVTIIKEERARLRGRPKALAQYNQKISETVKNIANMKYAIEACNISLAMDYLDKAKKGML